LAFSTKDLPEAQVQGIFGRDFDGSSANRLLRILHGRRVAGTLEDPAYAANTAQYTPAQVETALEYLRKTIPIDEVRNAGLRAEDELAQIERDMEQAEKRKAGAAEGEEAPAAEEAEPEYKEDPVYGESAFDKIRARNQAKQRARDRALEAEEKAKEERQQVNSGPLAKTSDSPRQITNPRVREFYEKAQSGRTEPQQLRTWERIMPAATVVTLVIGFTAAVSMVYEEPSPRYRVFRELTTSQATVATIIGINCIVYLGWRAPPLWSLFNRYMLFVVGQVKPLTLFTSIFSHQKFNHLLMNTVPLWFVGTILHDEIGRADFLTLYLACGSLGFLGSLVTYTARGWLNVSSLGGSGATLGLLSAYFWEHRMDGFKILGLPQDGVHGIVFLALIVAMQLAAIGRTAKLQVDVASHIAGIAAGIAGIELVNRRKEGRSKEVIEIWSGERREAVGEERNEK
jgi:rhomboid-like protein